MKNLIVVMISGRGSNLAAMLNKTTGTLPSRICLVLASNSQAGGIAIAHAHGIEVYGYESSKHDVRNLDLEDWLLHQIQTKREQLRQDPNADSVGLRIGLLALAGFMKILSADFLQQVGCPVVNIHPSLLPAYQGMGASAIHRQVCIDQPKLHGCTVHYVDETVDGGKVIAQKSLEVRGCDNSDHLSRRVLELEHGLYPSVLESLCAQLDFDYV